MKLDSVQVSRYRIPLEEAAGDATHGTIDDFSLITVQLRTRDGQEGLGYTYTVGTVGAASIGALIAEDLAPALKGEDPRCTEALWQEMWNRTHYVGRGGPASFALSAVDIALWDIKAKTLHEPLWRLLGGRDPGVKAYASGIDLHLRMSELQEQTRSSLEHGFRAIKMKVGRPRLSEDLARVRAIREAIGPDVLLMVDANMKWSVVEAIQASRALAEYNVYWLEEPTSPTDVSGHVRIQREGLVPVAAGENLHTPDEFESLISAGGVAFPQPDASNCGGITGWLRVARLAELRHLPVTTHGIHELHASLLAAVPNASFLEIHGFSLDRFLVHRLKVIAGRAEAPASPGHGVEFRWDRLQRYKVD